jgi:hypothetical protein
VHRLTGAVTACAGALLLMVSLAPGAATAASTAGQVTIYSGLRSPEAITAGPDGALWFTNIGNNSIG